MRGLFKAKRFHPFAALASGILLALLHTAEAVEYCAVQVDTISAGASSENGCPTGLSEKSLPSLTQALSLKLPAPSLSSDRERLGLDANENEFSLAELDADLLVILVFDMYCHVCHQSAKNMRWVVDQIEGNPGIENYKVIGLGRGDTEFEVQTFRKKLKLNFPAVPDRDKQVTDALGVRRTPGGYILCKKTGEYRLLSSFRGYLSKRKAEEFLAPVFAADP